MELSNIEDYSVGREGIAAPSSILNVDQIIFIFRWIVITFSTRAITLFRNGLGETENFVSKAKIAIRFVFLRWL